MRFLLSQRPVILSDDDRQRWLSAAATREGSDDPNVATESRAVTGLLRNAGAQ
jgi:hypothetical protein